MPGLRRPASPLLRKVRREETLYRAWRTVSASASLSAANEIREAARAFGSSLTSNLRRISGLLQWRYEFDQALGILKHRPGKKPRPIVIAPIADRVVQRAILDVLQDIPSVHERLLAPTSYGGIEGRRVADAIKAVNARIAASDTFYVRSDIKSFFSNLRKDLILDQLRKLVPDDEFLDLVRRAITIELANLAELRGRQDYFPVGDLGVAQGCCLSPLLGNLYLADFDAQMNGRGITCLRYIDDFVLLGQSPGKVRRAYENARMHLRRVGLDAYDLGEDPEKATSGNLKHGLEFLGCHVVPGLVRPSDDSQARLMATVAEILALGPSTSEMPMRIARKQLGMAQVLSRASRILRGWGDQYWFCNDRQYLAVMDRKVGGLVEAFVRKSMSRARSCSTIEDRQRLLGVHVLVDSHVRMGDRRPKVPKEAPPVTNVEGSVLDS